MEEKDSQKKYDINGKVENDIGDGADSSNNKNEKTSSASSIGIGSIIILLVFIVSLLFSCFDGGLSEEQKLAIKEFQNEFYDLYKTAIYDKIDGSEYYLDIVYMNDALETEFNEKLRKDLGYNNVIIKIDEVSENLYSSSWFCSLIINDVAYPILEMTIKFSSNMIAINKEMSKIPLD